MSLPGWDGVGGVQECPCRDGMVLEVCRNVLAGMGWCWRCVGMSLPGWDGVGGV